MSDIYNPEVGMPVDEANEWHVPEVVGQIWTAGEIQTALRSAGFEPYPYDAAMTEPCTCVPDGGGPVQDCALCDATGEVPLTLRRSRRWVRGASALRVPLDPGQVVSPYLGACVVALLVHE